jgi:hypothetical protein
MILVGNFLIFFLFLSSFIIIIKRETQCSKVRESLIVIHSIEFNPSFYLKRNSKKTPFVCEKKKKKNKVLNIE